MPISIELPQRNSELSREESCSPKEGATPNSSKLSNQCLTTSDDSQLALWHLVKASARPQNES
jgi:hypothetical protein